MYGINLNSQNLTGNFRGFALKDVVRRYEVNELYQLDLVVDDDDIIVLCGYHMSRVDNRFSSPLTPLGIALRGKRPQEKIELAANVDTHYVDIAVFSPNYRRQEEYGIEIYNDNGEIAYGSADYYLTPVAEVELPFGQVADLARIDFPPPDFIHFNVPAGRKYGVVLGSWGTGSANLNQKQINQMLSNHPLYRRHNYHYFGYYCAVPRHSGGQIQFRLGSSGVPTEMYHGRGRLPNATALIVDITNIPYA